MLCGCGQQVLEVGDPPFLIDAETHPLGIWHPDGKRLTTRQVIDGVPGHRRHTYTSSLCAIGQFSLFGDA